MKKVLLYTGQGSQKVGMGLDFYEAFPEYRELVDGLSLDVDVKRYMHEGPLEELSQTEHTQVCMAVFSAGVTDLLKAHGIEAEAACGLSLGEYGALYAAGVFTREQYISLLQFRGKVMMEAAKGTNTSMSAILGSDSETIAKVCEAVTDGYVTVANFNCPGQTVICGEEEAVAKAEAMLKEQGVKRCVRLNVSGPFHTSFMKPAGDALAEYFANMEIGKAQIPVAMNTTGALLGDGDVKELLVKQVQSSVHLEQDLAALLDQGYTAFLEIGPGNTMAGFLRKTAKAKGMKVNVASIDSVEDFRKVVAHGE